MNELKITKASVSTKLFVTAVLCLLGVTYITLLASIWVDTEMKVANVAEGYGGMEFSELVSHSHTYLPYYLYIFAIAVGIFLFTSYGEKIKRHFALAPFVVIFIDIGSMWLIRYANKIVFSWALLFAGIFLAISFLGIFALSMYDIWLRKIKD